MIMLMFPANIQAYTDIKIVSDGQVVDSFVGVDAVYATLKSYSNVDSNTTYSCAAFLKKFCSKIWGVTIYNINTQNKPPTVSKKGHSVSLKVVTSPRPGDIMQTKNYSHVAIVKSVNGSNATLIEQNWSYNSNNFRYARKDRTIAISSAYFYRMIIDGSEATIPGVNNYANLGNDFWAKIINPSTGLFIGKASTNNAELVGNDENYNTYWHFQRQSDGTYYILTPQGAALDVTNFGTAPGTNVAVSNFNGSTAQHWYFTKSNDTYIIKALCANTVLSVANNNNIQMNSSNGTNSQKFTVEKVTPFNGWIKIKDDKTGPFYSDESINFIYDAQGSYYYDLWLYKEGTDRKEIYYGYDKSFSTVLPKGKYRITLSASNDVGWTYEFEQIEFTVIDRTYPVKAEQVYNGRKYILYDIPIDWRKAKEYCEGQGGHLATVSNRSENDFLKEFIAKGDKNSYWLGGTDEEVEGEWKWITGEKFLFTDWYGDNPNNTGGTEHYLEIRKNYDNKWNDDSIDKYIASELEKQGFICEIEPSNPYTQSNVICNNNDITVYTDTHNIDNGKLIICAYNSEKLVKMESINIDSVVKSVNFTGNIDNIKVMIWNDFNSIKPLTKVEEIQKKDWIDRK